MARPSDDCDLSAVKIRPRCARSSGRRIAHKRPRRSTPAILWVIQIVFGGLAGLAIGGFILFLVNPSHPMLASLSRAIHSPKAGSIDRVGQEGVSVGIRKRQAAVGKSAANPRKVAPRKVAGIAKRNPGRPGRDDDLKLLIGTWDVVIGQDYVAVWDFMPNGIVLDTDRKGRGTWVASDREIRITWTATCWESFPRPLTATLHGDSWQGPKTLIAKRRQ